MPTSACAKLWEADPRRWERLRSEVAAEMVAAGWSRHAGKFNQVMMRKAMKRWAA